MSLLWIFVTACHHFLTMYMSLGNKATPGGDEVLLRWLKLMSILRVNFDLAAYGYSHHWTHHQLPSLVRQLPRIIYLHRDDREFRWWPVICIYNSWVWCRVRAILMIEWRHLCNALAVFVSRFPNKRYFKSCILLYLHDGSYMGRWVTSSTPAYCLARSRSRHRFNWWLHRDLSFFIVLLICHLSVTDQRTYCRICPLAINKYG